MKLYHILWCIASAYFRDKGERLIPRLKSEKSSRDHRCPYATEKDQRQKGDKDVPQCGVLDPLYEAVMQGCPDSLMLSHHRRPSPTERVLFDMQILFIF